MGISFNDIPSGTRVPFVFVEFDTTRAAQGSSVQPYKTLMIGQKLASGSKPELQPDLVSSAAQARDYYGAGSMLAQMADKYFAANEGITPLTVISIDDDGGGVKAAGSYQLAGPATASGTLYFYLGGRRYQLAVTSGDADTVVIAALVALITADDDRVCDVTVNGGDATIMDIDARHAGETGNEIDFRTNYFEGEELPGGLTETPVAMAGGSGNASMASVIAVIPEEQYNIWIHPWLDAANLTAMENELSDRFGPIRQIDGFAVAGKRDSFANLVSLGDGRNSEHSSIMGMAGPHSPWEWAGAYGARLARHGQADPARPFQTLEMDTVLAPADSERFSFTERNSLLTDGISTYKVDAGGVVRIERAVSTYQENSVGAEDESLRSAESLLTLSKLRYDFRTRFQLKYPRVKLADNGTRFAPGQQVITPNIGKAEAISLFNEWEFNGLVENADQFKRDLIVTRDPSDPCRLCFLLPPDLINQLKTVAAQISFLL